MSKPEKKGRRPGADAAATDYTAAGAGEGDGTAMPAGTMEAEPASHAMPGGSMGDGGPHRMPAGDMGMGGTGGAMQGGGEMGGGMGGGMDDGSPRGRPPNGWQRLPGSRWARPSAMRPGWTASDRRRRG